MMKALAAALLLLALSACNPVATYPAAQPAPQPAAGKPLPVAPPPPPMPDEGIACAADVRQCPDSSYVSRNPAKSCAFNPCPGEGKQ